MSLLYQVAGDEREVVGQHRSCDEQDDEGQRASGPRGQPCNQVADHQRQQECPMAGHDIYFVEAESKYEMDDRVESYP